MSLLQPFCNVTILYHRHYSFAFQLSIMSSPSPNTTPFDDGITPSSTWAKEGLQPRSLPECTIVIIASVLGVAVVLAVIIGAIHCIRRRRCRQLFAKQQKDIEKSLQRARPPILALDTDIPRLNERQRSAGSRVTMPALAHQVEILPVPLVHVRSAPLSVQAPLVCVTGLSHSRGRSATRKPLGSHPPGVAGRGISRPRPANRMGRFEEVGLTEPVQMYCQCSARTQYRG
jgi:hypothetical protein